MPFANWNGVTTHFRLDAKDPNALTVIFSNSLGTNFQAWDPLIEQLPDTVQTLRYDTRGHGLSDVPDGPYRFEDLASDLSDGIDQLGLKEVVVVGLSIGGAVAQSLAVQRADVVKGIMLTDTAMKFGDAAIWKERISGIEKAGLPAVAPSVMERWFTEDFRAKQHDQIAGYTQMVATTPQAGYLGCCAALRDGDLSEQSATIDLPTRILIGDQDIATPRVLSDQLLATIKGSSLVEIPGSGHIPCVENPTFLAKEITAFISNLT